MKLALIRRQFSATGGAELYVQRLLAALVSAGHETHLFAEKWQGQAEGVQFHSINVDASRAERPLRFAEGVNAALQQEKFDCVFSLERTLEAGRVSCWRRSASRVAGAPQTVRAVVETAAHRPGSLSSQHAGAWRRARLTPRIRNTSS
jgi:hypothetical protein